MSNSRILLLITSLFFSQFALAEDTANGTGVCHFNPSSGGSIGLGTGVTAAFCASEVIAGPFSVDTLSFSGCGLPSGATTNECDWATYNDSGFFRGTLWWEYSKTYTEVVGDPSVSTIDCSVLKDAEFQVSYDSNEATSCLNNCGIETANIFHVGGLTSGQTVMRGYYTGNECASGLPQTDTFSDNPSGCITGAGGTEACISEQIPDCGLVNGQYVCADTVPEGNCVFIAGGSFVCTQVAETTPPLPDNGTTGDVATPDATITDSTNGDVTNIYSSTTISSSTITPVNTSGGGQGPLGTASDPLNVDLVIDESGVVDNGYDDQGFMNATGLEGHLSDMESTDTDNAPFNVLIDWPALFGLPSPLATCSDVTVPLPGSVDLEIPFCSGIQHLRDLLAWALFLMTAWACFELVMTKPT